MRIVIRMWLAPLAVSVFNIFWELSGNITCLTRESFVWSRCSTNAEGIKRESVSITGLYWLSTNARESHMLCLFRILKITRKACWRRAQRAIAAPPGESEYNSGSGWKDFFSYPSHIWRPRSLSSGWNFRVPFCVRKLESWGYTVVKIAWSYLEPSLTDPPMWRTDGRTDGRWHIARYSIYAIAR